MKPRLRLVPDNPGPEFPRIGFCNDTEGDCTATCPLVKASPEPCPRGKVGLKWDIEKVKKKGLLKEDKP